MFIKFFLKKAIKIWQIQKLAIALIVITSLVFGYFFGFTNLPLFVLFLAWFVFNWNTFPVAIIAIGFIVAIPVLIFLDLEDAASEVSVYAYFSLVILVLLEISRYLKINLWIYRIQKWLTNPSLNFFKQSKYERYGTKFKEVEFDFQEKNNNLTEFKKSRFKLEFINNKTQTKPKVILQDQKTKKPLQEIKLEVDLSKEEQEKVKQDLKQFKESEKDKNLNKGVNIYTEKIKNQDSIKTSTDSNLDIDLDKIERAKKQIQAELQQEKQEKLSCDNPALEFVYALGVLALNVILFNFRNGVALANWLPINREITPSQQILSFNFITDRFFNFLIGNLNLDAVVVFNTLIQVSFLILFYFNYQILKKVYILFYKIDNSSKFFLFLLSLLIVYNPFTLQKILEGQFQTLISQTLLLALIQILLSFLITFTRTKTLYLNIFLQKGLLFSLTLLLISYFNFELLFLIIPILLLIFGFLGFRWLKQRLSKQKTNSDFYIKDSPEKEETINSAFKIQFLVLIFTFNLGWLFIFLTKMNSGSVRRTLLTEILTEYSPNLTRLLDLPLVLTGLRSYNFDQVPGLRQLWESQFLGLENIQYLYLFLAICMAGILAWILIFHIFIKKRWAFVFPAIALILVGVINLGLNSPFDLFNQTFFRFSSSSYLLLKNQSSWVVLVSLVSLLLVSKKIEKSYKYLSFIFLGFFVVLNLVPFFSLNQKANSFQMANLILELEEKCNPTQDKVLIYPLTQKIQSSQTRYPEQPIKNFYTQILDCPVYQPESFVYRQVQNELKLAPSDTESFFLNRILTEYPQSNREQRLNNLKANLGSQNIRFLLLDTARENNQNLALNLILDGLEPAREGQLYIFDFKN